jgi:hypothetical protein
MYKRRVVTSLFLGSICGLSIANAQQNTTFVVKLLAPISTKTSNIGDRFTALVEEPAQYNSGVLEGRITKLKQPTRGLGKGKPEIAFEFETLTYRGTMSTISANLKEVTNSSGARGVDEEGRVIGKTSNMKRLLWTTLASGAGAALGAATNGAQGAATGAALGAAVGFAISVTMTAAGSDVELHTGSHLTLDVYPRNRN